MRFPPASALTALTLAGSVVFGACASSREPAPVAEPAPVEPAPEPERAVRSVPYEGAFGPGDPPAAPLSPGQKPLAPSVRSALDVLYERPSPKGPPAIALQSPRAVYVTGKSPVIQVLPGPAAFPDKIPERLKTMMAGEIPFSNNVQRLPRGEIRLVSFDYTMNDTKLSRDSMAVEISFTDHEGAAWRIEQAMLAPLSPNPVAEPWFGGVVIDTLYHGDTGNGTPAVPLVRCTLCSWGWADVYKDDKRVASSAPLHIMVTSDTRDDDNDFAYACYDCTANPVREVHVVVHPSAYLPSPGGFLHVMWANADVRRGTPQEVRAIAPQLAEDVPTIELVAAPYLTWDRKEIRVTAGQKYRLIVHNQDPSSFHQFSLHSHPEDGEPQLLGQDVRHEEGMTSGRIGPLWKPGDAGHGGGQHADDPPGPENVFFGLPQGSTWATMIMFEEPGEYPFMCPVSNHYRRGMEGKFIVTQSGQGGGK